jgi:hypothetical protein
MAYYASDEANNVLKFNCKINWKHDNFTQLIYMILYVTLLTSEYFYYSYVGPIIT